MRIRWHGHSCFEISDGKTTIVTDPHDGRSLGIRPPSVSADIVLISHDHSDHSGSLGVFQRKFGLPVYVTPRTLLQAGRRKALGRLDRIAHFAAGAPLHFGHVTVETIQTPHDGVDGVAFVVDDGQRRLGILTDLGHVFRGLGSLIASLDGLILESNYEPRMLASGGYPPHLKRRIRGPGGHLSNQEAAWLVAESASARLRWLCLAHLSEENTPRSRPSGSAGNRRPAATLSGQPHGHPRFSLCGNHP